MIRPPAAAAGVGAPALGAATRLIPVRAPELAEPALTAVAPAVADDATAIVAPVSATAAGNGQRSLRAEEGAPVAAVAAGTAAAALAGASGPPAEPVQATLPPRVAIRPGPPGAGQRKTAARPPEPRSGAPRSRAARLAPWLIGVVALGVGVAAILVATGGGGASTTASTPAAHTATTVTTGSRAHHHATATVLTPQNVTVAVLNGTDVAKLAAVTGTRLSSMGYRQGIIHDAPTQTHATTIVAYRPGHQSAALMVARALNLGASAVVPVDSGTLAVACPSGPCAADVVVTIGQDLASLGASTSTTTT